MSERRVGAVLVGLTAAFLVSCGDEFESGDEYGDDEAPYGAVSQPVVNQETAWTFRRPINTFVGGSYQGRDFLAPANHLGEDSAHPHRTAVYAVANGVVRQVRRGNSQGYGSVVVIEHRLPDGEIVQSIYGHLCNHAGNTIPVNIGRLISKGELVGYVGDDAENGDGAEHLHLGIRRGAYNGFYCGYIGASCAAANYYDPTNFITPRLNGLKTTVGVALAPAAPVVRQNITFTYSVRNDGFYGGNFEFRIRIQSQNGAQTFFTSPTIARWLNPRSSTNLSVTRALNAAGPYQVVAESIAPGTETWWAVSPVVGAINPRLFQVR